ncbi:MAG TPA: ABC transporter substrate-binding protein [Roseiflexaceae bacterium]|nr:ABC transporter substrate-binding protein [Roseiflexaceae bacterium]
MRQISYRLAALLMAALLVASCGGQQTGAGTPGVETPVTGAPTAATTPAAGTEATAAPTTEGAAEGTPAAGTEATAAATPAAGTEATAAATPAAGAITKDNPPPVPNAEEARQYSGATIIYYGDSVGLGGELDRILAAQFTEDTGINVNIVAKPQDATENYAVYQRFFQAQSTDVDVMMLDVIWPAAFAPHLLDLSPKLGQEAQEHFESIVQNNTVDGKLIAMPWFADFGMLFYRTDLLQQYGFDAPPATWEELEQMAQTIQEGERANNPNFAGFVWQGAAYEGLTCNALEWIASAGGSIVEGGQVTVNSPEAVEMLTRAQGWIGTISPQGVTSYKEEDARNIFQGGNAAFMRNWPYAYAAANQDDSPIRGMFDVAPLPMNSEGGRHVGTVGGWQLGVSRYSQNPDAAIEFVRYMTSPEVQTYRAVVGSFVPTIQSVTTDPQVVAAMPFLENLADVERVTRPSNEFGENYNQGSTIFFQGVSRILQGQDPAQVLPQVEQQLGRFLRG